MAEARDQHEYTCQEVVAVASEYLEGTLTPEAMTALEVHLNFCDGCSGFVDQVRTTAALARGLPVEQIPEDVRAGLLAAFRERLP